jgi:3-oxoacyl-[acyl-carrier protein] reductase
MGLVSGKRVLITGGTSGLGRACARAFLAEGAKVHIFGRSEEKAEALALEGITYTLVDVSQTAPVGEAIAALLKEWGAIDVVINCAGITRDSLLMKMSEADWDEVMDTNLKSVYNVCQPVIRSMIKARQGKIINISSVIGLTGNPGQVNYASSKLGMLGFTRSLAKEVAARGICVNCIAPGYFPTDMTDQLTDAQKEAVLQWIPMGRFGDPRDIANAALFLGSAMSDYVTGQVIPVDGGMTS